MKPTVSTLADAAAALKSLAAAVASSPIETMTVVVVRIKPEDAALLVANLGAIASLADNATNVTTAPAVAE